MQTEIDNLVKICKAKNRRADVTRRASKLPNFSFAISIFDSIIFWFDPKPVLQKLLSLTDSVSLNKVRVFVS